MIVVGSYFPAWLVSGVLGIGAGLGLKIALSALGLDRRVAWPLAFYFAFGLIVAVALWLNWTGI